MDDVRDREPKQYHILDGAFVETAFSVEEVEKSIAEEKRRQAQDSVCAFLDNIPNRD